jgi:hypothetical protein
MNPPINTKSIVRLYISSAADSAPTSFLENTFINMRKIKYIAKAQKMKLSTVDVLIVGVVMGFEVVLVLPLNELYNGVEALFPIMNI